MELMPMSLPETKHDALVKPDMIAVLSRTHIAHNLHGFLLPVFEAISNAMDGIESRFGENARAHGEIGIQFESPNDPKTFLARITDNGVGLTQENYQHFRTPFSGHKLERKGRGFGRFIAFKVFSRILYSSRYEFLKSETIRAFRFDIRQLNELTFHDAEPDFQGLGLCVEYNEALPEWSQQIADLDAKEVLDEIGRHFLPYFLYKWLPKITVQFGDLVPENITAHFGSMFKEYGSGEFECEIEGKLESLTYSLTRIAKSKQFKNHCLLLSAADRIVGYPRDLTHKLGEPHFVGESDEKYIVIAVVRGEAFERRLNDARTSIDLPPKSIEVIVNAVSGAIQEKETKQIAKIKSNQSDEVQSVLKENPILRLGLRGRNVEEYLA
jgi:hypothetical protein